MFIQRDYTRTEHDDFVLNVEPKLRDGKEVVPVYAGGELVGWRIQWMYE